MYSFQALALLAVVGTLARFIIYVTSRRVPKGLKPLPGPRGYPMIGSILEFPKTFSYHKFKEWSDQYGPLIKINILGTTHVVISDDRIANDLLALRGANYSDRPPIVMLHELVSHNGNLGTCPQNKYWKNSRKLAAATMSSTTLEVWNDVQVEEAARLVCELAADPGKYEYLFERYSSIITLRILYDKKVPRGKEEIENVKTITSIVRTLERTAAPGAYLVDFIPLLKYLPSFLAPFKAEAEVLHQFEYSYFRKLVMDARESYGVTDEKRIKHRSIVHAFLEKPDSWNLSDFEIAYCLGTFLEGGSGTTSSAMQSYCLAMLHYPDWQKKVQKEMDEVVGTSRVPNFEDWPNLPTVRAAVKETLRWRPVVPGGIPHFSTQDDSYDGYFIPKGSIIHANQFAMFKDEAVYPDAEAFNPDRWLNPRYPTFQAPLSEHPNLKRFAGFGFGRRICPGLVSGERSLFIEISTLMWACTVVKKLDADGVAIPVPWYDYKPGNNTGPKRFDFDLKVRDGKRLELLRQGFQT